jgi:hypothetical protein
MTPKPSGSFNNSIINGEKQCHLSNAVNAISSISAPNHIVKDVESHLMTTPRLSNKDNIKGILTNTISLKIIRIIFRSQPLQDNLSRPGTIIV